MRFIECSVEGCDGAWRVRHETPYHGRDVRRAIQRGWRGAGKTGCLCADSDIRCPEHA